VSTENGRCEKHRRQDRKEQDERRGSAASRGYDARWARASKAYLAEHPLCVLCEAAGLVVAAQVTDHIKPHKGNEKLFWDQNNWQALCKACHDLKTTREGRWGQGGSKV
jgi:5-methylcytosine-specific restriction protein A